MRTNIDIDDDLMEAVLATGLYKSKKEAVEAGLTLLKHKNAQLELINYFGKIEFFDDIEYPISYEKFSRNEAEPISDWKSHKSK